MFSLFPSFCPKRSIFVCLKSRISKHKKMNWKLFEAFISLTPKWSDLCSRVMKKHFIGRCDVSVRNSHTTFADIAQPPPEYECLHHIFTSVWCIQGEQKYQNWVASTYHLIFVTSIGWNCYYHHLNNEEKASLAGSVLINIFIIATPDLIV